MHEVGLFQDDDGDIKAVFEAFEMTALERIKEIELIEPQVTASNNLPAHLKHQFPPETVRFLLKSFRVMREGLIETIRNDRSGGIRQEAEEIADKRFEEQMEKE